ncbi:MAG: D-alanine--D-alanine ligase family protein [Actinomycetota bacterium]
MNITQRARRPRVAVLFGGRSSEHQVSCMTASSVLRVLDDSQYDVVPVRILPDGRCVVVHHDDVARIMVDDDRAHHARVVLPTTTTDHSLQVFQSGAAVTQLPPVDVVFPLLHGPYGEDGTIQGLLELGDMPYVGSGVLASAASMDKHVMKVLFAGHGLPIGPYQVVTPEQWQNDQTAVISAAAHLGLPLFVKPARAGSSIGISRVDQLDALPAAIDEAALHDPKVVIEAGIAGRELECGVLQDADGTVRASVVGEIAVGDAHAFYNYEAKYFDPDQVQLSVPADIPDELSDHVRQLAIRTFKVMGCEGLARVDVFATDDGQVIVNEINTMPGFTEHSMYPRLWAATGVDYSALVDHLVRAALHRPVGLR